MRLLSLLKPSTRTVVLALVGIGLGALGALLSVAMAVDGPTSSHQSSIGFGMFGLTFFAGGPLVAMLALAGILEHRPLPKAAAFFASTLASLVSGLTLGIGMGMDEGAGTGVGGSLICCGLPTVLLFACGLVSAFRGVGQAGSDLETEDQQRLARALKGRRVASFAELAEAADIPEDQLEKLLLSLGPKSGGEVIPSARTWVSGSFREPALTQLLGMIEARGRLTEGELAAAVGVPVPVIRHWVYALAGQGRFEGSVHWPDVFSKEASRTSGGACPSCGGKLSPVARGKLVCSYCGAEVFP